MDDNAKSESAKRLDVCFERVDRYLCWTGVGLGVLTFCFKAARLSFAVPVEAVAFAVLAAWLLLDLVHAFRRRKCRTVAPRRAAEAVAAKAMRPRTEI